MAGPALPRRNGVTVLLLAVVVAGMAGLSFASVPLYRMFCAATGYGGTTQRAAAAPKEIADAVVIAVLKTAGIDLIKHRPAPPGRGGNSIRKQSLRDWPGARHCNKVAKPASPLQILNHE